MSGFLIRKAMLSDRVRPVVIYLLAAAYGDQHSEMSWCLYINSFMHIMHHEAKLSSDYYGCYHSPNADDNQAIAFGTINN